MPSVRYPIAADATDILNSWTSADFARAARQTEAEAACGRDVQFVSQTVGPKFDSEEEGLDYFAVQYPKLLEDVRAGRRFTPDAEDVFARLMCRAEPATAPKRLVPTMTDGQRWAAKAKPVKSMWQLSLSYWKIIPKRVARPAAAIAPHMQARAVRKQALGQALTAEDLQALALAPMMSYRPQKALDMGLFEFVPPENPNIIIADE